MMSIWQKVNKGIYFNASKETMNAAVINTATPSVEQALYDLNSLQDIDSAEARTAITTSEETINKDITEVRTAADTMNLVRGNIDTKVARDNMDPLTLEEMNILIATEEYEKLANKLLKLSAEELGRIDANQLPKGVVDLFNNKRAGLPAISEKFNTQRASLGQSFDQGAFAKTLTNDELQLLCSSNPNYIITNARNFTAEQLASLTDQQLTTIENVLDSNVKAQLQLLINQRAQSTINADQNTVNNVIGQTRSAVEATTIQISAADQKLAEIQRRNPNGNGSILMTPAEIAELSDDSLRSIVQRLNVAQLTPRVVDRIGFRYLSPAQVVDYNQVHSRDQLIDLAQLNNLQLIALLKSDPTYISERKISAVDLKKLAITAEGQALIHNQTTTLLNGLEVGDVRELAPFLTAQQVAGINETILPDDLLKPEQLAVREANKKTAEAKTKEADKQKELENKANAAYLRFDKMKPGGNEKTGITEVQYIAWQKDLLIQVGGDFNKLSPANQILYRQLGERAKDVTAQNDLDIRRTKEANANEFDASWKASEAMFKKFGYIVKNGALAGGVVVLALSGGSALMLYGLLPVAYSSFKDIGKYAGAASQEASLRTRALEARRGIGKVREARNVRNARDLDGMQYSEAQVMAAASDGRFTAQEAYEAFNKKTGYKDLSKTVERLQTS